MPRLIGIARAKELIFTAKILSATEAASYGIVNRAGDSGTEMALQTAGEIKANGPLALRMAKQAIETGAALEM